MTIEIAGYIPVARKYRFDEVTGFPPYRGVERDPWGWQWNHLWGEGKERALMKQVFAWNRDFMGISTAREFDFVQRLRSNTQEILVVRSPRLLKAKGALGHRGLAIDWFGFEPFAEWSLLHDGVFSGPDVFRKGWAHRLNAHGLFDDPALGQELLDDYVEAMNQVGDDGRTLAEPMYCLDLDMVEVGCVVEETDGE